MARCPHCRKHFRVMDDEDPREHPCPSCGYSEHLDEPEPKECVRCGGEAWHTWGSEPVCTNCFNDLDNARHIA